MTQRCSNCQENIDKTEGGKCPRCGAEFKYLWNDNLQTICDEAVGYKRAGQFDKALKIYERLNLEYPNNPLIFKSWGKTLVASGNYDLAIECFSKELDLLEFYGEDIEKLSDNYIDCNNWVHVLLNEPRKSKVFLNFVRSMSGNVQYKGRENNENPVPPEAPQQQNNGMKYSKLDIIEFLFLSPFSVITYGIIIVLLYGLVIYASGHPASGVDYPPIR